MLHCNSGQNGIVGGMSSQAAVIAGALLATYSLSYTPKWLSSCSELALGVLVRALHVHTASC